ncbi:glycosyltransferase [Butyrivibrio sp. VCD2006]|uniref:glycosyltransferase n=1 Tax=Butyrivibrio sp. VCD2006 TaxID=1280664 RepID=UPI000426CA15|nr:glycosyltransferase [Butyrivibrio sp. VCD2006]
MSELFDVSVILLTYHSDYNKTIETVNSILKQENITFELIISEDSEQHEYYDRLRKYLDENKFTNYFFINNDINHGTTINLYNAVKIAKGPYIKPISPGDMLYNEHILYTMINEMKRHNALMGFGIMQFYETRDNERVLLNKSIPYTFEPYIKRNKRIIAKHFIGYGEWIAGASQIFESNCLCKYLEIIAGRIKYCEDCITIMIILDDIQYVFLPEYVIYYEYGTGISTSGTVEDRSRTLDDQIVFCDILYERYKQYKNLAKRCKAFYSLFKNNKKTIGRRIREFILLPEYGLYRALNKFKDRG